MNIPFESIKFSDFYKQTKTSKVEIDSNNRKLLILDANDQIVDIILFSKNINHRFTFEDLMKSDYKVGDYVYAVYVNGYKNANWLWAGEVTMVV